MSDVTTADTANLVFVYGTLKKDFHNHTVLGSSKYLGECSTISKHSLVSLGSFPGVIYRGGTSCIRGEVYEVFDDNTQDNLDSLEGYPSFYDKAKIMTTWGPATMYVLSEQFLEDKEFDSIQSGEWK